MLNWSRQRRRKRNNQLLSLLKLNKDRKKRIILLLLQKLLPREISVQRPRRFSRNQGWFEALNAYSNKRFKEALRVSRDTFSYILRNIRHGLERKTLVEEPISPEERLAIALYRYGRGDYCYTIEKMTGRGNSTVWEICNEVAHLIVDMLIVDKHVKFPSDEDITKRAVNLMERCGYAGVRSAQ